MLHAGKVVHQGVGIAGQILESDGNEDSKDGDQHTEPDTILHAQIVEVAPHPGTKPTLGSGPVGQASERVPGRHQQDDHKNTPDAGNNTEREVVTHACQLGDHQ
jgi:hypothetical protein